MILKWKTSRRHIIIGDKPLVMGILNVTPDSFSDGGNFASVPRAVAQAEKLVAEGADIIDVGGESTRPGSVPVPLDEEIRRVVPVIEAITRRSDVPVSIDTSKMVVAKAALDAGAEIINDVSGLRWDQELGSLADERKAGLILMHSRGAFESMHHLPPVDDIFVDIGLDFRRSIAIAKRHGVADEQIVLDIGLGFGKTQQQNLELLANLDKIVAEFAEFPVLVGASRKSFIAKIDGNDQLAPSDRLAGSIAAAIRAVSGGAKILRVHDVAPTIQALRTIAAIAGQAR